MNWREESNCLVRDFEFKSFIEAFAFLTQVAILAEKANHHPEIHNVYNRVTLRLSTHDAGSTVTDKDRSLASKIDEISLLKS